MTDTTWALWHAFVNSIVPEHGHGESQVGLSKVGSVDKTDADASRGRVQKMLENSDSEASWFRGPCSNLEEQEHTPSKAMLLGRGLQYIVSSRSREALLDVTLPSLRTFGLHSWRLATAQVYAVENILRLASSSRCLHRRKRAYETCLASGRWCVDIRSRYMATRALMIDICQNRKSSNDVDGVLQIVSSVHSGPLSIAPYEGWLIMTCSKGSML